MTYSFKCFNCGEISTSYNLNNYYNCDQFVYKCNNPNCNNQFWMIVSNSFNNGEFVTWRKNINYRYGDCSRVEATLFKHCMYYEFLNFYNNDNHNVYYMAKHKISKTENMINFIIKYIDNLIFC